MLLQAMSVKRRQHPSSSDESSCNVEEVHPALKKLKVTDADQAQKDYQQPDQHIGILQPTSSAPAAAPCQHSFYPMNAVLKELHMARLQRQHQQQHFVVQEPHAPGRPS